MSELTMGIITIPDLSAKLTRFIDLLPKVPSPASRLAVRGDFVRVHLTS
jgi:hypothetical protein